MRFFSLALIILFLLCSNAFAGSIGWEAEDALVINPPLAIFEDGNLSNGKCIYSPTSNSGSAEYEFDVPKNGTYYMWAHHLSIDAGRNSYHLIIDDSGQPADDNLVWDTILDPQPKKLGEEVDIDGKDSYNFEWGWDRIFGRADGLWNILTIRTFELKSGSHMMYLWVRERETKVDCFCLTDIFSEQPVFPDETTGLAVDPKEKLAITWGLLK